jgi:hypothetical protein
MGNASLTSIIAGKLTKAKLIKNGFNGTKKEYEKYIEILPL